MGRRRNIKVNLYLNQQEKNFLEEASKKVGITQSNYIRLTMYLLQPKEKPGKEFYNDMKLLHNIANNMNQIAKKLNIDESENSKFYARQKYENEIQKLNNFILEIEKKYLDPEKKNLWQS